MDALDKLREALVADFAQRLKEQAAQYEARIAEKDEAFRFWRQEGLATIEEMQSEVF